MTWLIVAACFLVSFVFSGIESGILSVNRVRLAHRVRQRDRAALKLEGLLTSPDRSLITVLIVTNLANIFALVLAAHEFVGWFGQRGYVYVLAIYLPVYLLLLELLPKSLFRCFPYRALAALAEPLRLVAAVLVPLHWLGGLVQRFLFKGASMMEQRRFLGREDFKFFAAEGEKTGTLSKAESEMISNVVDFRSVTAHDVMTPLDPSRTLHSNTMVAGLLERSARENHDRWLVVDDAGAVTGVVSAFEVLVEGRRDVNVGVYQRRIVSVGPAEPAYNVVRKLRAARSTIAIVRGAGTPPLGVLTWGDLIRRLVAAAGA